MALLDGAFRKVTLHVMGLYGSRSRSSRFLFFRDFGLQCVSLLTRACLASPRTGWLLYFWGEGRGKRGFG